MCKCLKNKNILDNYLVQQECDPTCIWHVFCFALTGGLSCPSALRFVLIDNLTGQTGPYLSFHL